ncbi:peptide methionine sulfoxide reductase MsrA-like [Bolinopsis microptera]|uniref:peptide methionine sulfoxide reductase MsrA-like n=1 Tax=Bolinopsis microptera TaxID=2820187 RepID=UPI00307AA08D
MGPNDSSIKLNATNALPGREKPLTGISEVHAVNGNRIFPPFPEGTKSATFGMGCFWGVERSFWKIKGVYSTHAGYAGGYTKNPTYQETCTGATGHAEVVRVIFDPEQVKYSALLKNFWENHNPIAIGGEGRNRGPMYRSAIFCDNETQLELARKSAEKFQQNLDERGGEITTEIKLDNVFYYAEDYHQQYLHKNPGGYCSLRGTGVNCIL